MSEKFLGHVQGGTNVDKQGERLLCYLGKKVQPPTKKWSLMFIHQIFMKLLCHKKL